MFFLVNSLGKKMVKLKIQERELMLWHERTSQPEFDRFKRIHNTYGVNYFWKISKQNPKFLTACKSVVRIISCFISSNVDTDVCCKCSKGYTNIVDHCISECAYLHSERVLFWDKIYQCSTNVYVYLRSLDKISLSCLIFGEEDCNFNMILGDSSGRFWCTCITFLHRMWSKYNDISSGMVY